MPSSDDSSPESESSVTLDSLPITLSGDVIFTEAKDSNFGLEDGLYKGKTSSFS